MAILKKMSKLSQIQEALERRNSKKHSDSSFASVPETNSVRIAFNKFSLSIVSEKEVSTITKMIDALVQ